MSKFIPRVITADMATQGYNNEGRGKCIGFISDQKQHEKTCAYAKNKIEMCSCRIGLWQEEIGAKKIVNEMPKTAKRKPKITKKLGRKKK